jgi:predicted PhzF superfamily epimerase YddE/YHI9
MKRRRADLKSFVVRKLTNSKLNQVSYPVAVKGVKIVCHNLSNTQYSDYDFVSRYFNPWVGIDEDPVNGKIRVRFTYITTAIY